MNPDSPKTPQEKRDTAAYITKMMQQHGYDAKGTATAKRLIAEADEEEERQKRKPDARRAQSARSAPVTASGYSNLSGHGDALDRAAGVGIHAQNARRGVANHGVQQVFGEALR